MAKKRIRVPTDTNLKRMDKGFVIKIIIWTLVLSVILSLISTEAVSRVHVYVAVVILLLLIFVGILFDIMGIAVTSASEAPFHSMAARRVKGAKQALGLVRNADKVSNFCNDVVGDISGIVSGGVSAVIIAKFWGESELFSTYAAAALTGIVTTLTVGGKAMGKSIAIRNSNTIVYHAAILLYYFSTHRHKEKSGS